MDRYATRGTVVDNSQSVQFGTVRCKTLLNPHRYGPDGVDWPLVDRYAVGGTLSDIEHLRYFEYFGVKASLILMVLDRSVSRGQPWTN